jgi:hypothetical protein
MQAHAGKEELSSKRIYSLLTWLASKLMGVSIGQEVYLFLYTPADEQSINFLT